MAKRNYVKITNGSSKSRRKNEVKWDDLSLIVGFYNHNDELVDVMDTEFDYISNGMQEKIQRWIYDGVSPLEDEETAQIAQLERSSYAKPYNQY